VEKFILYSLSFFLLFYPLVFNPFSFQPYTFKLFFFRLFFSFLAFLFLCVIYKSSFTFKPSHLILFILFTFLVLSTLFSLNLKTAFFGEFERFEGFFTLIFYFLSYLIFSSLCLKREDLEKIFFWFISGAVVISFLGLFEHFLFQPVLFIVTYLKGSPFYIPSQRSQATFANPLYLSSYLIFPLFLSFFFSLKRRLKIGLRYYYLLSFSLISLALLLTLSRAAWISVIFFLLISPLLFRKLFHSEYFKNLAFCLALIIAFSLLLPLTKTSLSHRVRSILPAEKEESWENRLVIWKETLPLIEKTSLFGSGPDTFKLIFPRKPELPWGKSFKNPIVDKAHNEILQIASTVGIFYLLSFFWLFIYLLLKLYVKSKEEDDHFSLAIFVSLLAYFLSQQSFFSQYSFAPFFWIMLGLGSGVAEKSKKVVEIKKSFLIFFSFLMTFFFFLSVFCYLGEWNYRKGKELKEKGNLRALYLLEKAVAFSPWEENYLLDYGKISLNLYVQTGNNEFLKKAEDSFSSALNINSLNEFAYYTVSSSYLKAAQKLRAYPLAKKALHFAKKGISINPYSAIFWEEKGNALGTLGVISGKKEYFTQAVKAYKKALLYDSQNAEIYYNLGWTYEKLGWLEEAENAYRKCLSIDEYYPGCRESLKKLRRINH